MTELVTLGMLVLIHRVTISDGQDSASAFDTGVDCGEAAAAAADDDGIEGDVA